MRALPLLIHNLWTRLKFLKRRAKFKVTRSIIMVWCRRSCQIRNVRALSTMVHKLWPRFMSCFCLQTTTRTRWGMTIVLQDFVTAKWKRQTTSNNFLLYCAGHNGHSSDRNIVINNAVYMKYRKDVTARCKHNNCTSTHTLNKLLHPINAPCFRLLLYIGAISVLEWQNSS